MAAREAFTNVIVRQAPGADAEKVVRDLGGTVGRDLGIIGGFSARVPSRNVERLRRASRVHSVTPDRSLRFLHAVDGYDPNHDPNSVHSLTKTIKAPDLWRQGITGSGIDVALIDSGVVPVNGLTAPGKIVNGTDLSFESQSENLRYLDTFGHGTHMAGIIAGRDDGATPDQYTTHDTFTGVAPDAGILSVKVATSDGTTDVSQVIAAIDWVVQHRSDNGLNVRVLNLSFGTDSTQDYTLDPLAYAVEVAWRRGIVVVAAAGNAGETRVGLNDPARDPFVIAVGADDSKGTPDTSDDAIPAWSARGDGTRSPDVVAPGRSVASLRDPTSNIDVGHPEARVGTRFFRGSGTSQATAAVSGAAALLLSQRPSLTPDQVKALLTSTARAIPGYDATVQGAGLVNLKSASTALTPQAVQTWTPAGGTGSLEDARGSAHVAIDGDELRGEQDIFGNAWNGTTWSSASAQGTTWSGGNWNGTTWSGSCWCGTTWSGTTWSGTTWSGTTWSGTTWSGTTWSGTTWSGTTWSGTTWSGTTWSGTTWSGSAWAGALWG